MEDAKKKRLGFFFDQSSCSGCKTCQAACKDKNGLPLGVLWRRIYEVSGGTWRKDGNAWVPGVYAYNISLACNHCEKPLCFDSCPTGAISKQSNGIVVSDDKKCMGCRYCEWSCPYGAPQYDRARGVVTKCDLCRDLVEKGRPPACVAACPMRALEFGEFEELRARYGGRAEVFPLPAENITEPSLVIKPHKDAARIDLDGAGIGNWDEV